MAIFKLPNVRLSFPDIWVAKTFSNPPKAGEQAKYKATFLVPKGSALDKAVRAEIKRVATEKWGAKADGILKSIEGNVNKYCYQDGSMKSYDGYEGMMALAANTVKRPEIRDRDKSFLTQADGKPYGGCYVNGFVEIFGYTNSGNGISATLKGIQFYKDGDAFSGGTPVTDDDYEDLSDAGDAEDDLA
jgi:hypothetical protein